MEQTPLEILTTLLVFSAAISAVAMIVTKSTLFSGLREWIEKRSKFFGELTSCPLCTSVWVSALVTVVFTPVYVPGFHLAAQLCISWLAMITVAAIFSGMVYRAFAQIE
jgi:hypothetical protein